MTKCGIYWARATVSESSWFGKVYIGKSVDIDHRKGHGHINQLKAGNHNAKLQPYWNKYYPEFGEECLEWGILLECRKEELNFWERLCIASFDSLENGFNCTPGGESGWNPDKCIEVTLTNMHTGETHTAVSIEEFARQHGLWTNCIAAVLKGKQAQAEGWYDPKQGKPKTYILIDPQGNEHEVFDVKEFCRNKGLRYNSIIRMLNGHRRTTQGGWTRPDTEIRNHKYYELLSPEDELLKGYNPKELCRERNLCYQSILDLINGDKDLYMGWRRADCPDGKHTKFTEYRFESPDGKIYEGSNINEFARQMNLHRGCLLELLLGHKKTHKGWKLPGAKIERSKKRQSVTFINPQGEIVKIKSMRKLCLDENISYHMFKKLSFGHIAEYKGWKLAKEKAEDCSSAS